MISCVISQRYSKMKAIHNVTNIHLKDSSVVLYLKDTQKWKQFTTKEHGIIMCITLCYISKILKNESNSQRFVIRNLVGVCCVISQRYSKMKAIHNTIIGIMSISLVVLYLKDTQKWKQFTTHNKTTLKILLLCYISKILKNESNSQQRGNMWINEAGCVISQRYSKMKAIHN